MRRDKFIYYSFYYSTWIEMKCPACGEKLINIMNQEEWYCENPDCPECGGFAHPEFYGRTQKEINGNYKKRVN